MNVRAHGSRRRAALLTGVVALGLLAGCSTCGKRSVPFKRGAASEADAGDAPAATSVARAGTAYPAGTQRVELAGKPFALPAGSVRAALDVDLDGDSTADGLVVTDDPAGLPSVQSLHQSAGGWEAPRLVGALAAPGERCSVVSAALELIDGGFALARAELACGGPDPAAAAAVPAPPAQPAQPPAPSAPDPPPPGGGTPPPVPAPAPAPVVPAAGTAVPAPEGTPAEAAPPPYARRMLWVLALQAQPRPLERVALPASDQPGPKLEVSVRGGDFDGDGHSDLQLGIDVSAPELPATHLDVRFWNRAGGLARDRSEPEQTLLALADSAKTERRRKPTAALALARQVLAVHGALCRESGHAQLGLDGAQGLDCGPSLAAGRAGSVLAALLAADGKLLDALQRHDALRSPALRLTDNDWERVRSALGARVDRTAFSWREGPSVVLPPGSALRLPVVAFLDEQRVLLRGPSPRSYELASGATEPIGVHGATLIIDPGARFALSAVVRSCEGPRLSIVRVAQVLEGVVAGPPVSEPLITPAPFTPGTPCTPALLQVQPRDEQGEFRPLAWTAQGVLLARGAELWLLALDASAQAAAPARQLAAEDALPALGYSGEVTSDGRVHALITPLGIALLERASGRARLIALPDESSVLPSDLALSPSGKAIAIVRNGRLFVATPAPAPTAVPPPPPAAPPAVKSPLHEPPPAP